MDFSIPEELRMLRDSARRFVQQELLPLEPLYANEADIPDDVRAALQAKAKALGFWIFDLPQEFGGGGVGYLGMCLVFEELARCNVPSFRAPTVFTPYLGSVLFNCTPEQQKKYLHVRVTITESMATRYTSPGRTRPILYSFLHALVTPPTEQECLAF